MILRNKVLLLSFVCLLARAVVSAQSVFGPPEAGTNSNENSSFAPFATVSSGRFQQVYAASSLAPVMPPGGAFILALAFRVDANTGFNFDIAVPNVQLNFSTTLRGPDGLSTTFTENTGLDDKAVFGPGLMRLGGAGGGGSSSFNVFVDFRDNPFYYNPANGNLLMDFRIFTGAGSPPSGGSPLDAFNVSGDSVSSVSAYSSSLPASGSPSSLGLATEFFTVPVPEPASWALLLVGVGAFCFWRKKKPHERKSDVPH
jgi:hypothetical protein